MSIEGGFVTIQSWMITELKLKRNEIMIFAIIYGTSQNGAGFFYGTKEYLCEWTGYKKRQVQQILANLVKKKYLKRDKMMKNNIEYTIYYVSEDILKIGCDNNRNNNKKNNNNNKNRFNNFEGRVYSKEHFEELAKTYFN